MLKVDYLVLADAAAAADGKHYIHGAGWEYLYVASFPVSQPMISVAIRLRIPWEDTNYPHNLELDVVDADGQSILPQLPGPIRGPITVGRPPAIEVGADQVACLVINLMGLEFTRRGAYVVVLRIEGTDASRAPFRVELHPAIMGGTPPQG